MSRVQRQNSTTSAYIRACMKFSILAIFLLSAVACATTASAAPGFPKSAAGACLGNADEADGAIDSFGVLRVKENGLIFDKGLFLDGKQNLVAADHRFDRTDSMFFAPQVRGWEVVKGMITMMWSMKVMSPAGKVLYQGGTGNKTVERYPAAMVNDVPFLIELFKLDATVPYYDVEFTMTDKVSAKGIEGVFRINLR